MLQGDRGQGVRKRKRQEIEGERERGRYKGEGKKGYLPWRDKGLPVDGEETDVVHRQVAVFKGKWGNSVLR